MRSSFKVLLSTLALAGFFMGPVPAEAAAPASLGGALLRLNIAYASLRSATNRSISFRADGVAQENWVKIVSTLAPRDPPIDGLPRTFSYTYNRLSDSTATLTLITEQGVTESQLTLRFTGDLTGDVEENPSRGSGFASAFTLVEGAAQPSPLVNISTRVRVHPGEPTILGFICAKPADFLIRIAGPALANFQVPDVWAKPKFQIFSEHRRTTPSDPNPGPRWDYSVALSQAAQRVGAFPFPAESNDRAVILNLEPGPHTIVVQPDANDPGGNALIEVYQLY